MKISPLRIFLTLLTLTAATAQAQLIGYTDGSQVNLLNAYNASLSMSGTNDGSSMAANNSRFYVEDYGGANYQAYDSTPNPAATLDFGTIRNVKTVDVQDEFTIYGFTAATVETSNDGSTWTTQGNVVTNPSGSTTVVTLNSAVNARYVRLTPTSLDNSRWVYNTIRAFGSSGSLAGDTNLSILANGGLSASQSITTIGSVSPINIAQMIAPATVPLSRQLMYSMGNGSGFKLNLGQTFAVDRGTINLTGITGAVDLTLYGSTDGTTFTPLYTKSYTSAVSGFDLFNFSFAQANASYLELAFSNTSDSDIRVSDFAFFQATPVPEPATIGLLSCGALALVLRRKFRQSGLAA